MRTIQTFWEEFESVAIPAGASQIQRQEMRRAFYAGATAIMSIMVDISEGAVSDPSTAHEGALAFKNLLHEADAFIERIGVDA